MNKKLEMPYLSSCENCEIYNVCELEHHKFGTCDETVERIDLVQAHKEWKAYHEQEMEKLKIDSAEAVNEAIAIELKRLKDGLPDYKELYSIAEDCLDGLGETENLHLRDETERIAQAISQRIKKGGEMTYTFKDWLFEEFEDGYDGNSGNIETEFEGWLEENTVDDWIRFGDLYQQHKERGKG